MKKLLITLLLAPLPALAHFQTGHDLLSALHDKEPMMRMMAMGYVLGVNDSIQGRLSCVPEGTTARTIMALMRADIYTKPQLLEFNAAEVVAVHLSARWPCKQT